MYDAKGRADLYWNSIIGAAHRYYDWDRLMEFYQSFHETVDQGVYESLFWLALENSTFEKMRVERPAAAVLREHYAREQLKNFMPSIAESRDGWILEGHYRTALGEDSGLPDLVSARPSPTILRICRAHRLPRRSTGALRCRSLSSGSGARRRRPNRCSRMCGDSRWDSAKRCRKRAVRQA